MTYPCEVIRDLMPLYIDEVLSQESRCAVEEHILECEECGEYLRKMREEGASWQLEPTEDEISASESLRRVRKRLGKRTRRIIISSAAAALVVICGFYTLFNVPLKSLSPSDVSVSVSVYPMRELVNGDAEKGDVTSVRGSENDDSETFTIEIPDFTGTMEVTEELLCKHEYISVITWSSDYFLREINYRSDYEGASDFDGTLYVKAFKTTFFSNKAPDNLKSTAGFDFRRIDRVVYVDRMGAQTVLWENAEN